MDAAVCEAAAHGIRHALLRLGLLEAATRSRWLPRRPPPLEAGTAQRRHIPSVCFVFVPVVVLWMGGTIGPRWNTFGFGDDDDNACVATSFNVRDLEIHTSHTTHHQLPTMLSPAAGIEIDRILTQFQPILDLIESSARDPSRENSQTGRGEQRRQRTTTPPKPTIVGLRPRDRRQWTATGRANISSSGLNPEQWARKRRPRISAVAAASNGRTRRWMPWRRRWAWHSRSAPCGTCWRSAGATWGGKAVVLRRVQSVVGLF